MKSNKNMNSIYISNTSNSIECDMDHSPSHIRPTDNYNFYPMGCDRSNHQSFPVVLPNMGDFENSEVNSIYYDPNRQNHPNHPNNPNAPTPLRAMQIEPATIDPNSIKISSKYYELATYDSSTTSCDYIKNGIASSYTSEFSNLMPYQGYNDTSNMSITTAFDRVMLHGTSPNVRTPVTSAITGPPIFDYATASPPVDGRINFDLNNVTRAPIVLPETLNNSTIKTHSKKSRAPSVLPRQGGVIVKLNENDVLCGRGGRINSYIGNVRFRYAIAYSQSDYLDPEIPKTEKGHIAAMIVQRIRSIGGRFLIEGTKNGTWYEIGDSKAIRKTCQAIREYGPNTRNAIRSKLKKNIEQSQDTSITHMASNNNDVNSNVTSIYHQTNDMANNMANNFINTNDRWSLPNMHLNAMKDRYVQPPNHLATVECNDSTMYEALPSTFDNNFDEVRQISGQFDYVFGHAFHPPSSTFVTPQNSTEDDADIDDGKVAAIPSIPQRRSFSQRRWSLPDTSSIGTFR